MNNIFNYDFLKIEFKDIYEDIENLKKKKVNDNIEESISYIVNDIIYYIYKKNNIVYDEKSNWHKSLEMLKKINIIPIDIEDKIFTWERLVKVNYSSIPKSEDELFEIKLLYEILVWFVINFGEENYSLILNNLNIKEKKLFEKYLLINEEDKENIIDKSFEDKEEIANQLVEKGENYYFARGVNKDDEKAYKYFLEATKYKNEYAEAYLGLFYEKGIGIEKDYDLSYKWYYKAALKGNAFAQYSLGAFYFEGKGVEKDYNKAFIWFQKSAGSDYVVAYYQLAVSYYSGLGVEKDYNKAFEYHKKAAENDLASSQYALSLMYKNGEGCEENLINAYYWLEKAAENDYEDAYYIIGRSYLEGICVEVNYKKAFNFFTKGYLALDTNCIEALADMYLKGLSVNKDVYIALELYNKALELGDKSIFFKIGKVYEDEGLINQAISIYLEGHIEGNLKCTQRLGIMYYNGEGVEKDLEKAIEYMEIASEKKEAHGMYVLAVAYYSLNKFGDKTKDIVKELLKEACELGSYYAADYLASIMLNELKEGKEVNTDELINYIKFGVENELKESIFKYAYIHEKGIGVEKDYEEAYYYYNLAAEIKYIKAMLKLGDWYKCGIFLNKNIDLAIKWYEEAANEDCIEAIEKLIDIYENGIGKRKNDIKAIYYVFKLIDLDAIKGKSKLIYYCFKGIGIEENKEKGYELLKEIKDIDLGTEKYIKANLGKENLIDINNEEIIKLYKEGIELGNLECYGALAIYLYKKGLNKEEKYKELFEISMEGIKLGINECNYIFLKDKLEEIKEDIITIEELIIIKKLKNLINNGFYEAINDLIKWCNNKKPEDKEIYYKLKQDAIYYNVNNNE